MWGIGGIKKTRRCQPAGMQSITDRVILSGVYSANAQPDCSNPGCQSKQDQQACSAFAKVRPL